MRNDRFLKRLKKEMPLWVERGWVGEEGRKGLERPKDGQKVTILVAVDRYGNAGIKSLLVNGKERYKESLF